MTNDPHVIFAAFPWATPGPTGPHPLDLSSPAMLVLPGRMPVVDALHPARLDWRFVTFALDLEEGRWHHFLIAPKPGGRDIEDIAHCPAFAAALALHLTNLYRGALPYEEHDLFDFPQGLPAQTSRSDPDTGAPAVSFHANAKAQARLKALPAHARRKLAATWRAQIAARDAARAAAPMR